MIATGRKKKMVRRLSGFWSEERNLSLLLGLIVFEIFILPSVPGVINALPLIELLNNLIFSFLLLFGVIALTRHRLIQSVFGAIVAFIIITRWWRIAFWGGGIWGLDLFLSLLAVFMFVVIILASVYKAGPVTTHRIQGAVAVYLLIAMTFSLAYFLIEYLNPGSFQFPDSGALPDNQSWKTFYYFSICNLTTLGYGDILPLHPLARNLVMIEAIIGQLYPVILLSRLVALHTHEHILANSRSN